MEMDLVNFLWNSNITLFIGGIALFWILIRRLDSVSEKMDNKIDSLRNEFNGLRGEFVVLKEDLTNKFEDLRKETNSNINGLVNQLHEYELKNQTEHAELNLTIQKVLWYLEEKNDIPHSSELEKQ